MERTEILAMLEKDIQTLGRNHNAEVKVTNVDDDSDFVGSFYKSNVPLVSDARMLAEAYGLDPQSSVESDDSWGYTGILVTADTEVKEPDTMRRTLCGATRVYKD